MDQIPKQVASSYSHSIYSHL